MQFKLANIICDNHTRSVQFPTLYCRADSLIRHINNGIELLGGGEYDFTTYFNALSLNKWEKYTNAENFSLHLEIEGSSGQIVLTWANQFSFNAEEIIQTKQDFDATTSKFTLDIEYPKMQADMVAFKIKCNSDAKVTNSYYFTEIKEKDIKPVELALCATTFKKEDYILPNMKMIFENICCDKSDIANHFKVHIVDNGKTIKQHDLPQSSNIILHPNDNVGGSGGFARGMIEALHGETQATHILLMDDDVEISPESIKRTYALLSILNEEYENAIVSGSMIDLDFPNKQWEDVGYIDETGHFRPVKDELDLSSLRDCVENEIAPTENARYAAWWYCVIPATTIKNVGLPLPLFIRSDDTEYGFRCGANFITMNSICIFHKGFHIRYDSVVERYQTTRNTLIANAITGCASKECFLAQLKNAVIVELKKFNYENAILALEGFEDFMRGPKFIMQKGIAEKMFLEKHKTCEQLKPLKEAILDVPKKLRDDVISQINRSEVESEFPRSFMDKVKDHLTINNQKTTIPTIRNNNCVVIPSDGWVYTPGRFLRATSFFAVDFINKKAIYRKKDKSKFRKVWSRYKADLKQFKKIEHELYSDYASVRDEITSEEFWREYLGI